MKAVLRVTRGNFKTHATRRIPCNACCRVILSERPLAAWQYVHGELLDRDLLIDKSRPEVAGVLRPPGTRCFRVFLRLVDSSISAVVTGLESQSVSCARRARIIGLARVRVVTSPGSRVQGPETRVQRRKKLTDLSVTGHWTLDFWLQPKVALGKRSSHEQWYERHYQGTSIFIVRASSSSFLTWSWCRGMPSRCHCSARSNSSSPGRRTRSKPSRGSKARISFMVVSSSPKKESVPTNCFTSMQ